jgi:flagellar basal body-associated protein FliL
MANLHVQPKRKNYLWVWILIIILIIAAAVYYYINYYSKGIKPGSGNTSRVVPSLPSGFAQALAQEPSPATITFQ